MKAKLLCAVLASQMLLGAFVSVNAEVEYKEYFPVYGTPGHEAQLDVEETIEVAITAYESKVVGTTEERDILGVCLEWGDGNSGFMKSNESLEFSEDYLELLPELRESGIYNTRTAGGSLNLWDWKTSIGEYSKRKIGGDMWCFTRPSNYGPIEWVKQFTDINPDCTFTVGLNVMQDSPEDLADYAEFMLGDETTEWGKKRIELGVKDPVKVGAFELGNEMDGWLGQDYKEYNRLCLATIHAIRERFPEAKFMMVGKSYPNPFPLDDMSWRIWTIETAKALGEYCDYVSFHPYYDGETMARTERYLNVIQQDLKSVWPDKEFKFGFTEAAVWPRTIGDGTNQEVTRLLGSQTQMLTGVLSLADFLTRCFKRGDVWSSNNFCWAANDNSLLNDWGMLGRGVNEQKWYVSGVLKLYNIYDKMLGEKIIYSFAESDNKYAIHEHEESKYSCLVTQNGDDELMLIMTNKTAAKKFHNTFNFEHDYTLVEETVFTAPDMESRIEGKDTADVFTTTTTPMNVKNFKEYTMPEQSVVFLRLQRSDKAAGDGEVTFEGESKFSDIETFWGKNEINNLAAEGILNGTGDGKFEPYETLTRAQMAQMLKNAIINEKTEITTEEGETTVEIKDNNMTGTPFSDVSDSAWYKDAVYDVYASGYMRGTGMGLFNPNEKITMEELVTTASRVMKNLRDENDVGAELDILTAFENKDKISEWAKEPVAYAAKTGLISRFYENGKFEPDSYAKRGDAAVILYRLAAMK